MIGVCLSLLATGVVLYFFSKPFNSAIEKNESDLDSDESYEVLSD